MRAKRFGLLILALSLAASGASCVPCKHPLSDEKTSKIDKRLIGVWQAYDDETKPADGMPTLIGRKKGAENTLDALECYLDAKSVLVVDRVPLFVTNVGSLHLISVPREEKDKDGGLIYDVFMYEMPDKDTLKWYIFDDQAIGAAIASKELAGTVKVGKSILGATRYSEANITASSEELRNFIEKTGKKCFDLEVASLLKRIRTKH